MAIYGVNYAEFEGGLLFKGNNRGIQGIIVHNSASAGNAFATANYNKSATEDNIRKAFAHYYIDNKNVIQLARENWLAWHSGKKEWNETTIGIEICVNPIHCDHQQNKTGFCDQKKCVMCSGISTRICKNNKADIDRFIEAERVAYDLVTTLMAKYKLSEDKVLFHHEVSRTACPFYTQKLHGISAGRDFLRIFQEG